MLRAHFYHLLRRRRRHRSGAQIVLNAVANAVKYTPPRAGVAITARLGPAASSLLVEVTDAGPGLRGQTLSQLVEEFGGNGTAQVCRGCACDVRVMCVIRVVVRMMSTLKCATC